MTGVYPSPSIVIGIARRTMALRYLEDFVAWPTGPDAALVADALYHTLTISDHLRHRLRSQKAVPPLLLAADHGFEQKARRIARVRPHQPPVRGHRCQMVSEKLPIDRHQIALLRQRLKGFQARMCL